MNNNIYLVIGIMLGLAAALYSILAQDSRQLPDYAVARVNDSYITRAVYERALAAADTDKRNPVTAADRQHILNRLIDEELLIQYGIRQGLVRSDRQVKSTLVQSVIQAKSLQAEAREISDEDARTFFEQHRGLFSQGERVRVGMIRLPVTAGQDADAVLQKAQAAASLLAGGKSFAEVEAAYHEGGVLNLPNTLMPRGKLVDYLGPTLADMAFSLEPGQASEPVKIGMTWQVLYVHEKREAPEAVFTEVRELVLAEMRRRASEDIVRRSLDEMRRTESIYIAEDVQ